MRLLLYGVLTSVFVLALPDSARAGEERTQVEDIVAENSTPWVMLFQSLRFDIVIVPWWIPVRIPEPHWTFSSHDARGSDVFVFDRQTGKFD